MFGFVDDQGNHGKSGDVLAVVDGKRVWRSPGEFIEISGDARDYVQTRRLRISIEVQNIGDETLQPYIERALNIWMARGGPEDGLVEIVPASPYHQRGEITIVLALKHDSLLHPRN